MKLFSKIFTLLAIVSIVTACHPKKPVEMPEVLVPGPNQVVLGITANNELVRFNANTPSTTISKNAITGLVAGEKLLSIDYRPATGELYALSDASKIYIINTTTFASRVVSATPFTPAVSGSIVQIDFNPTVDRIRLVSNNGQNIRLNPETGAVVATDAAINGVIAAAVQGIAYTNNRSGAATTVLYDIDVTSGKLYRQDPPNNGTLAEVGSLGVTFTGAAAFDISPDNSAALVATKVGNNNSLFTIDVNTGKLSKIGNLNDVLLDIAIPTDPVAYGVDAANALQIFNPTSATPSLTSKAITGLQVGENILGIDFRPANGQLYALGSSNRLYTLNTSSGVATMVGTAAFSTPLIGADFGMDFNPTVDRIRVVSNTGQNVRLNPIDGTFVANDAMLNPGIPMVTATAYTNNFAGATTTRMLNIDANTDRLAEQSPPNNGTQVDIGPLGIDITSANGFDIGSSSGVAYLAATVGGASRLYTVNLTSGSCTAVGTLSSSLKAFTIGLGF